MIQIKKDNRGFTLIELLVVIMIVGLLSVLAIGGYTQYRKTTLLDFTVDSVVSQMYQLRDRTIRGNYDSERAENIRDLFEEEENGSELLLDVPNMIDAKCYGLKFEKTDVFFEMNSFYQGFSNKNKLIGVLEGWEYEGCLEDIMEETPLDIDNDFFNIQGIKLIRDDGTEFEPSDRFILRFVPPKGELEIQMDLDPYIKDLSGYDSVEIQTRYGEDESSKYKRIISIDLNSITTTVKQYEEVNE